MLTGCSSYMPGRLPGLTRGRDARMVCFLQPGRFSILGMALQSPTSLVYLDPDGAPGRPTWRARPPVCCRGPRAQGGRSPSTSSVNSLRPRPAFNLLPGVCPWATHSSSLSLFFFQNHSTVYVRKSVGTPGSSDWLSPLPENALAPETDRPRPSPGGAQRAQRLRGAPGPAQAGLPRQSWPWGCLPAAGGLPSGPYGSNSVGFLKTCCFPRPCEGPQLGDGTWDCVSASVAPWPPGPLCCICACGGHA